MAAAALVQMLGGTPEQALDASSISLSNLLGLVCDPVGGLVEVPCQNRNAIGVAAAFSSAQLALAGIKSLVPFDQMAHVMLLSLIHIYAEQVARGLVANQVGIQIVCLDDNVVRALDLAADARNGKAALAKGHQMVTLLNNDGIDKHVRVVVVLVAVVAVDGDELNELADLWGSQAAAAVLEHHLLHLLGKRLDRRGDLLDDGALLALSLIHI